MPLIFFRQLVEIGVLAELQSAHVGCYGPAILDGYAGGVAVHNSETIGHDIEEMTNGNLSQAFFVEIRWLFETALDDHSVSTTGAVVTGGAKDVEAILASLQKFLAHR